MVLRWRAWSLALAACCLVLAAAAAAEDTPPGLLLSDSERDLDAMPSDTAAVAVAQKREAPLSNSYGEPIPADAYGPPRDIPISVQQQNQGPVYTPELPSQGQQVVFQQNPPPGAYGPPQPVSFPSVSYEGPPPPPHPIKPSYQPKPNYGPPKFYGPPKQMYGPPKKLYGPPKQNLPKINYGVPFNKAKLSFPKPIYGVPKQQYGPPKPIYGPPKQNYGAPQSGFPELSALSLPSNSLGAFATVSTSFGQNVHFGQQQSLPAPIYGTPFTSLPNDLKPNFPIPADTYGPPGHALGPIGPTEQLFLQEDNHLAGHYGPPQPDPNPQPPHPGIPAPPTPPHVIYDGWKPIPGVSVPFEQQQSYNQVSHSQVSQGDGNFASNGDQYGPPPPPPIEIHVNLDEQPLPNTGQSHQFSNNNAQITTGYSSVHQDALADIDLNSIVGGDSNHIDQSKTIFEAHYTEPAGGSGPELSLQALPSPTPSDSYGAPPQESFTSSGPYPASIRQQGAKGLTPPSGFYGVPPGSQYGAPPRPPPANLPIPYGTITGGGHSGGHTPKHPIKFRESVPEGLIQQIAHTTSHKDHHNIDHLRQGPAYLPPPIRDIKDANQQIGNHGVSFSIEPTSLFSLPHSNSPINFQNVQQPSTSYGSPVDSYSAPLLTVSDHATSGSSNNEITATVDGTILANLSNLEAAAILKHCPYHEAILRAARAGEKIPSDLASSYVASLSSLGSTFSKSQQTLISPQNGFNTPAAGSESVNYNSQDLQTASHTLVQTILPPNEIRNEKFEKTSVQKSKSLKNDSGKQHAYKENELNSISEQIFKTSEKIKSLNEETKQLQQNIISTSQNLNQVNGQIVTTNQKEIPVKGNYGTYSLQIQSADGDQGKGGPPSIPHEQLLSEGLLQSILQAIEQPGNKQRQSQPQPQPQQQQFKIQNQNVHFQTSGLLDLAGIDAGGLVLPAGYEPIDHTKEKKPQQQQQQQQTEQKYQTDQEIQSTHKNIQQILNSEIVHRGDIPECDQKHDNSIRHTIVVPAPSNSIDKPAPVQEEVDENDVAIFFNENKDKSNENSEPVTEISVATSISEEDNRSDDFGNRKAEFGDKIDKKEKKQA